MNDAVANGTQGDLLTQQHKDLVGAGLKHPGGVLVPSSDPKGGQGEDEEETRGRYRGEGGEKERWGKGGGEVQSCFFKSF